MGIETKYYTNANEPKSLGLASAAVGQIPKVKAVDSNGVPTEWEATAMPSSGGGGGGSPNAVLYTEQTLTDEQKKQARHNVDAAIDDFQITATIQDFPTCALDKTFNQIQEAISNGKRVFALLKISGDENDIDNVLSLWAYTSNEIQFTAFDYNYGLYMVQAYKLVVSPVKSEIAVGNAPTFTSEDTLPQVEMEANPYLDMQIATKKYVDDALAAIVDGTEVSY